MTENKEHDGTNNSDSVSTEEIKKPLNNKIIVLFYIYIHIFGIIGLYILFVKVKWMTALYFLFLIMFSYAGLTVGAHRLYAHQTFIASSTLRFFLVLAHTIAGVGPIYDWVLSHRLHHKYHETDRDPFDHRKGFFYSHVWSNLQYAPSDWKSYSKSIDMRDVDSDWLVWVQQKFYWTFFIVLGLMLPINVVMMYWQESLVNAILVIGMTRLMITTHIAWLVNSALLIWGLKKGDRYPVNDNSVFFVTKSYWLNYHYIIPWDWRNDEFGLYEAGFATFMIKIWHEMGLIEGMKTTTTKDVQQTLENIALSKMSMKEAFEQLKEKSEDEANKQRLMFRP